LTKLLTEGAARRGFELLDETRLLPAVLPEISRMKGVEQPPQFHPEGDVWIHTRMVCEELVALPAWRALPEDERRVLFAAAVLHDVGKPDCTRIEADGLRASEREVLASAIASDYFSTLRIPLVRGRMWSASDDARGEGVAVINETMARQLWPNDDPIGKRVRDRSFVERRVPWRFNAPGRDGWFEVVGVVRDTPNRGLLEPIAPAMYYSYTAALSDVAVLLARTKGNQAAAERDLRMAVSRADANLPIIRFITPDTFMGRPQGEFVSGVLLSFAGIALLLASFGLFSVVSYSIVHRTREFAIRLALGAPRSAVLRAALQSTAVAVGLGLGVGLALSVGLNSVLARWSIHHMDDPSVLAAAGGVLVTATLAATMIPARRATSIEPAMALRAE